MGIWDLIGEAVDWVKEKIEDAVDWVKDKLSSKTYDEDDVEDHIDVDAVLAEFRADIKDDVDKVEKKCMDTIYSLFLELMEKTKSKFPDLVDIIKTEQRKVEYDLNGSVMKYVKEHLSKNDPQFLNILKMNPGKAKKDALDTVTKQVLEKAENDFRLKLKRHTQDLLKEFTDRLNTRIAEQEQQMNWRIEELEKLQKEAEKGKINVDALKEDCAPAMEAAECIIQMLK